MISLILAFSLAAFSAEDSKLIKAVHDGSTAEVKTLAKSPSELNWKDSSGNDALFYAVSLNDLEKAQALLSSGASTKNLYTEKKESLLFEAARLGSVEMINLLVKKDPNLLKIRNTDGESPVFEAVKEDQSKVVKLLAKKGLSLNEKNKAGKTPASYVDSKNKKMVALFREFRLTK